MLLDVVYKYSLGVVLIISIIVSTGILMPKTKPIINIKTVFITMISIFLYSMIYTDEPQVYLLIMGIIPVIISSSVIYNLNVLMSATMTGIIIIIITLYDAIIVTLGMVMIPEIISQLRDVWYLMTLSNMAVSVLTIFTCYSLKDKVLVTKTIIYFYQKTNITISIFLVATAYFIAMIIIYLPTNPLTNSELYIAIASIVFLYILIFSYIKDKIKLHEVTDKYDRIYTYVKTFENWIEEEQLVRHEYKNTLSKLLEITKEPEVTKEINKLLKANVSIGKDVIELMSAIPKGGLKGILYYKISMAKENKVKMYVNVSETVKNKFKKFSKADYKTLCFLIGIFCDNAIEAASKSKKKQISVEVYYQQDKFHFVISNSTDIKVDLNKIENKGESTKGKGRGSGLYFAKKLLSSNSQFVKNTKQQQNYFIQELIY